MKILVPLDGSEAAETAVPIALHLAQKPGDRMLLILVVTLRHREQPAPAEPEGATVADAQSYLDAVKSHLCPAHVGVDTAVWLGLPAAGILRAAAASGADAIVMTTHGRSGQRRESCGSVADAVLQNAAAEVIVVRPRRRVSAAAVAG